MGDLAKTSALLSAFDHHFKGDCHPPRFEKSRRMQDASQISNKREICHAARQGLDGDSCEPAMAPRRSSHGICPETTIHWKSSNPVVLLSVLLGLQTSHSGADEGRRASGLYDFREQERIGRRRSSSIARGPSHWRTQPTCSWRMFELGYKRCCRAVCTELPDSRKARRACSMPSASSCVLHN